MMIILDNMLTAVTNYKLHHLRIVLFTCYCGALLGENFKTGIKTSIYLVDILLFGKTAKKSLERIPVTVNEI